jgi:hypothetical protein
MDGVGDLRLSSGKRDNRPFPPCLASASARVKADATATAEGTQGKFLRVQTRDPRRRSNAGIRLHPGNGLGTTRCRLAEWEQPNIVLWRAAQAADAEWMLGNSLFRPLSILTRPLMDARLLTPDFIQQERAEWVQGTSRSLKTWCV